MEALFPGIEDDVIKKKKGEITFMSRMGWPHIVGTNESNSMGIGTELAAESALDVHGMIMNFPP